MTNDEDAAEEEIEIRLRSFFGLIPIGDDDAESRVADNIQYLREYIQSLKDEISYARTPIKIEKDKPETWPPFDRNILIQIADKYWEQRDFRPCKLYSPEAFWKVLEVSRMRYWTELPTLPQIKEESND